MRRVLGGMPRDSVPPSPVAARGTDGSMLIILAALLCALVFALGLNSVVRCLLRRAAPSGTGLPRKGLGKRALRRIPVAVFGEGAGVPAAECPICLGEFADGEKVRVLPPCGHSFHASCIDTWLAAHSSCPTCRQTLQDGVGAVPAPGGTAEGRWILCS